MHPSIQFSNRFNMQNVYLQGTKPSRIPPPPSLSKNIPTDDMYSRLVCLSTPPFHLNRTVDPIPNQNLSNKHICARSTRMGILSKIHGFTKAEGRASIMRDSSSRRRPRACVYARNRDPIGIGWHRADPSLRSTEDLDKATPLRALHTVCGCIRGHVVGMYPAA